MCTCTSVCRQCVALLKILIFAPHTFYAVYNYMLGTCRVLSLTGSITSLNDHLFPETQEVESTFSDRCPELTFSDRCPELTFSDRCPELTFSDRCPELTFSDRCHELTFSDHCPELTFSDRCPELTFSDRCPELTFSDRCPELTFSDRCPAHSSTVYYFTIVSLKHVFNITICMNVNCRRYS